MTEWPATVGFLLTQLRASLLVLIPILESVRIPWREEEAYDEWDRITRALYESMVLDLIYVSTTPEAVDAKFPQYATVYDDYSSLALFSVESPELTSSDFFFVRFATVCTPLDSVKCTTVELIREDEFRVVPFEGCRFSIRLRENGKLSERIYELMID